jgi:hypothetical protein
MYKYNAEITADSANNNPKDQLVDLTRFNHYGKYSLNYEWNFQESAHNIQAISCINSVLSPLILCSTSDK